MARGHTEKWISKAYSNNASREWRISSSEWVSIRTITHNWVNIECPAQLVEHSEGRKHEASYFKWDFRVLNWKILYWVFPWRALLKTQKLDISHNHQKKCAKMEWNSQGWVGGNKNCFENRHHGACTGIHRVHAPTDILEGGHKQAHLPGTTNNNAVSFHVSSEPHPTSDVSLFPQSPPSPLHAPFKLPRHPPLSIYIQPCFILKRRGTFSRVHGAGNSTHTIRLPATTMRFSYTQCGVKVQPEPI